MSGKRYVASCSFGKDRVDRLAKMDRCKYSTVSLPEKATEPFTRKLCFDEIDAIFRMDDAQIQLAALCGSKQCAGYKRP